MRVCVFGANGKIGQHVVQQLSAHAQHEAIALVRKQSQLESLSAQGVNVCLADLTDDVASLTQSLSGADAVIFTAGSGGDTDGDMTLRIDLDGAVKAMEAAEAAGVQRFILVSALQAQNREHWHPDLEPYYIAKHYADRELMRSGLQYTIVRPGLLTDQPGQQQVATGTNIRDGEIAREDVASLLIALMDAPNAVGKAFDLVSGDTPIERAVQQL